jgi:PKD repeat protein
VNDYGQIAGSTIDGAFIDARDWSDYGAFGINQAGEVAGYEVGTNPYRQSSLPYNPAIFVGNKWKVFDIARLYPRGTRQGVYADRFILNSINDGGYAVGYKYRYGLAGSAAILIDTNGPVNDASDVVYLSTPAGGRAVDINDSNIIVGTTGSSSRTTPVINAQAYKLNYDTGNLAILPVLEGGLRSSANDINGYNQVVGSSESAAGNHAVIWDETGTIVDLNNMIMADTGWVLTSATAINDNGDITGSGTLNGEAHGFLLTSGAIPEPPPVGNQPPVAVASADRVSGRAPLLVAFSSQSTDPDGTVTDYSWNFMDGTTSPEENPSHEFTVPGTYPVTLTVTDNEGKTASDSISITVRKAKGNRK